MITEIQKRENTMDFSSHGVKGNTILPISQQPSEENSNEYSEGLDASLLFSLFTADIIKEEVLFTR